MKSTCWDTRATGSIIKSGQKDTETSITPLRLIGRTNVLLKNYGCELFNLIGMVKKVELISTFTTAVCESWNVSDKYTWGNAGDHEQLSIDVRIIGAIKRQFFSHSNACF